MYATSVLELVRCVTKVTILKLVSDDR